MDKSTGRVVIICAMAAAFALILIRYLQFEGKLILNCSEWQYPVVVQGCQKTQLQGALYGVIVICAGIAAWVVNDRCPAR